MVHIYTCMLVNNSLGIIFVLFFPYTINGNGFIQLVSNPANYSADLNIG